MSLRVMLTLPGNFTTVRVLHATGCLLLFALLSWALLSPDPFAVVENGPFELISHLDDLILHCGAYFLFAVMWMGFVIDARESWVRRTVLGLVLIHGTGTEILQAFVPGRTCDPLDGLANIAGIILGTLFARTAFNTLLRRRPTNETSVAVRI